MQPLASAIARNAGGLTGVLGQKFVEKVFLICAPVSEPRLGRHNLAQGEALGTISPTPFCFPSPRLAGEGVGGRGRTRDSSADGLNAAAPEGHQSGLRHKSLLQRTVLPHRLVHLLLGQDTRSR